MADTNDVLFEQQDNLGILTFNRPQRLNALSGEIVSESLEIIERISAGRSVRALMITGAGRGFCSGADLGGDQALENKAGELGDAMRNGINKLVLAICNAPFPVVTAVNGAAAGAGVGIALAGDFLIASESMRLLLTFSRIGMGLDAGTSWFLSQLLGTKRAAAISMLIEPIDAKRRANGESPTQSPRMRTCLPMQLSLLRDCPTDRQERLRPKNANINSRKR